jgi:hypothetical protein
VPHHGAVRHVNADTTSDFKLIKSTGTNVCARAACQARKQPSMFHSKSRRLQPALCDTSRPPQAGCSSTAAADSSPNPWGRAGAQRLRQDPFMHHPADWQGVQAADTLHEWQAPPAELRCWRCVLWGTCPAYTHPRMHAAPHLIDRGSLDESWDAGWDGTAARKG